MSLAQYGRFLAVGGLVAAITIGCREFIGHFLGADTPLFFSLSVVLAYVIGIVLSFVLNQRFTFKKETASGDWSKFVRFVAIAGAGLVSTWLLSLAIRYGLKLHIVFGEASAAIAFGTATLLSSGITYPLNALLVFRGRVDPLVRK